jgi:CRP-like cAMP-binding protein
MMNTVVDQKSGTHTGPANRPMPTLESPKHCRAYAGFLMADHLPEKAAVYYRKAADIYIDQGQVLRALAVSLAMWQTAPPQPEDVRHFSEVFKKAGADAAPLVRFLSQLDEEVLAALIPHMQAEILDASHTLIKPGQIHDHLYINVSGTLKDAIYLSVEDVQKTSRSPTVEILENEFFGEIYPFEKEAASQSYIETLSPVEVIKISKERLRKLCAEFNQFEVGLMHLLSVRKEAGNAEAQSLRRTTRLKLGVPLDMMIEMVSDNGSPIQLKGYTQDISIGGICLVLDGDSCTNLKSRQISDRIVGETIKIAAGLNYLKVFFSGKIAWWKFTSHEGRKTIALGVEFNLVPPNYKGILMSFLSLMKKEDGSGSGTRNDRGKKTAD